MYSIEKLSTILTVDNNENYYHHFLSVLLMPTSMYHAQGVSVYLCITAGLLLLFNTHHLTHTRRMCNLGDKVNELKLAEIRLTIICSSRESIATILSKYVLCKKKKWCIEMFDKWKL